MTKESEKCPVSQLPNAAIKAEITSDTIRIKAIDTIIPNENNRTLIILLCLVKTLSAIKFS